MSFWHVRFRCDQRATTQVPGHLHVSIETSDFFGTKKLGNFCTFFGFSIAHLTNFAHYMGKNSPVSWYQKIESKTLIQISNQMNIRQIKLETKRRRLKNGSRFCQFKQGVCHTVALPFTLKSILWKLKYFTMQKQNLQKIL